MAGLLFVFRLLVLFLVVCLSISFLIFFASIPFLSSQPLEMREKKQKNFLSFVLSVSTKRSRVTSSKERFNDGVPPCTRASFQGLVLSLLFLPSRQKARMSRPPSSFLLLSLISVHLWLSISRVRLTVTRSCLPFSLSLCSFLSGTISSQSPCAHLSVAIYLDLYVDLLLYSQIGTYFSLST